MIFIKNSISAAANVPKAAGFCEMMLRFRRNKIIKSYRKNAVLLTILLLMLTGVLLGGCGRLQGDPEGALRNEPQKLTIVTTIFPEYDWTRNILGSDPAGAELILLMDNGVDPHSYQPSVEDIMTISGCDLFIYVGGESDAWVEDALKEAVNPDLKTVNLMEALGDAAKEEAVVEGMQEEGGKDHEHEEEPEYDEHVWLSLKNAMILSEAIEAVLSEIDPENTAVYQDNLDNYKAELAALDKKYEEVVSAAAVKTLLFGDRFPFRYLADDYGLSYYAAFPGCSAETEASFETILFLSEKVKELSLPAVLTIDGSDKKIAETVAANAGVSAKILTLDSMQSVKKEEIDAGTTYLSLMEKNLSVLQEALQ